MQTFDAIKSIVSQVKYKDWEFIVGEKGDGFLVQVQFMGEDTDGSGKLEIQKCRKWFVSQHSCDSEVVRSCFLAIRQAEEHELCERFAYKGQQVYNPHLDMDRMADFICAKPFEIRKENDKNNHELVSENDIKQLLNTRILESGNDLGCGITTFLTNRKALRSRAITMVQIAKLEFLYELVSIERNDLRMIRNTGLKTIALWEEFLKSKNLHLGMDVEKYGFKNTKLRGGYKDSSI